MKKLIFLLLLLLIATPVFAQQQEAKMSLGVIGGSVPAAGGYVLEENLNAADNDSYNMGNNNFVYHALSFTTKSPGYTVTKVEVKLVRAAGVVPIDFTAKIFDAGASNKPGNLLGTSTNTLLGSDITAVATYFPFTFAGIALSASTVYHISLLNSGNAEADHVHWSVVYPIGDGLGYHNYGVDGVNWTVEGGTDGVTIKLYSGTP